MTETVVRISQSVLKQKHHLWIWSMWSRNATRQEGDVILSSITIPWNEYFGCREKFHTFTRTVGKANDQFHTLNSQESKLSTTSEVPQLFSSYDMCIWNTAFFSTRKWKSYNKNKYEWRKLLWYASHKRVITYMKMTVTYLFSLSNKISRPTKFQLKNKYGNKEFQMFAQYGEFKGCLWMTYRDTLKCNVQC